MCGEVGGVEGSDELGWLKHTYFVFISHSDLSLCAFVLDLRSDGNSIPLVTLINRFI